MTRLIASPGPAVDKYELTGSSEGFETRSNYVADDGGAADEGVGSVVAETLLDGTVVEENGCDGGSGDRGGYSVCLGKVGAV